MEVQPSRNGETCLRINFLNSQREIRKTGTVLREKFFSDERREDIITIKRTELFGNTLKSA
jgi:hypothetical protein